MATTMAAAATNNQQLTAKKPRKPSAKIASVAVKSANAIAAVASSRQKPAAELPAMVAAAGEQSSGQPQPRRRHKCRVTIDISACRYAIVRKCLSERDYRLVKKRNEPGSLVPKWDIWWSDRGDLLRDLPRLSPFQKVNHFPSMEEICRKDFLANNLNAIYKVLPSEFDFFPRSFLVPSESVELRAAMESGPKNATYIVKPRTLCQGKGISLIQSFSKLPSSEPCVVQRYIDNPLLIDGLKFDLRIYVLVYSVHPLKIYIFRNGLARFCTTPFEKPTKKNLTKKRMHLTNYAINKKSKDFQQATTKQGTESQASKRSVASVLKDLEDAGRCSSALVWAQISDIVVKTLLCVEPKLQASYKSYFGSNDAAEAQWGPKCFEILGFDIMLDANGKAWLFEVNHAPSFAGDSPLDRDIKTALISSTLEIIGVTNEKKRQYVRQQRNEWAKRLWTTTQTQAKKGTETSTEKAAVASVDSQAKEEEPEMSDASESEREDDAADSNNSTHTDGESDELLDEDGARSESGRGKVSLKNIIFGRNRVAPTTANASGESAGVERGPSPVSLGNKYSLLYPIVVGQTTDSDSQILQCYDKVRDAAQVNKSKLWT